MLWPIIEQRFFFCLAQSWPLSPLLACRRHLLRWPTAAGVHRSGDRLLVRDTINHLHQTLQCRVPISPNMELTTNRSSLLGVEFYLYVVAWYVIRQICFLSKLHLALDKLSWVSQNTMVRKSFCITQCIYNYILHVCSTERYRFLYYSPLLLTEYR